jgi:EmrB/QacA subfamily drug resistance transporter
MQRELGASVGLMQWVVEAYALMLASLVLVGGALGDRYGRRRAFDAGVVVFALASVGCGAAPTPALLVAARAVQGVGAALLVPGSLALISAAYDDEERGRAIGTWSAATTAATALGPVAGGWLLGHASWRWLFLVNAPLGVITALLSASKVEETRDDEAPKHLDWPGALFVIGGLGLVVYGLLERSHLVATLGGGAALLAGFVVVEARSAAPMVPLGLFRSRDFAFTNALTLLLYAALGGGLFFVPFNLIQVQGYSPAAAGAAFIPTVVLIAAMSPWAGGLVAKRGPRLPLVVGPSAAALGFALLALPGRGGSYFTTYFPGVFVLGVGMGLTVAPLTAMVMGSVEARHAGLASGINNAVSRAAGLLAIAALGVVLVARFDAALDAGLGALALDPETARAVLAQRGKLGAADVPAGAIRDAFELAYVSGFRATMLVSAGLAALAALAGAKVSGSGSARAPASAS